VVAVLVLALGIGANTAIFSLLDQAILRALPVKDPGSLVLIHEAVYTRGWSTSDTSEIVYSYPHYKEVRDQVPLFDGVIARARVPLSVTWGGVSERAAGDVVSGNFFSVLGVGPALGRVLVPGDDRVPGSSPVAVLSYGYWQSRLGGDPAVVGGKISLNAYPFTIVGVAARGFGGLLKGRNVDVFVPIAMKRELTPDWNGLVERDIMWLNMFARLRPGLSRERAEAALQAPYRPILEAEVQSVKNPRATFRERYLRQHISLLPAAQGINLLRQTWARPLLILAGLVGLVLLITCANISGLMIAKGTRRQKEVAIRLALGASRGRITRQLVVESMLLTLAGGVAGLAVGSAGCRLLLYLVPQDTVATFSAALDGRLLIFNLCVAVLAGLVCGLLPASAALRADAGPVLKESSAGLGGRLAQARWRGALVVGQLALSIVLVVTASLFAVSLRNLLRKDPGFHPENLLAFTVEPELSGYTGLKALAFFKDLERRLQGIPGVVAVGAAQGGVFNGSDRGANVTVEGYRARQDEDMECAVDAISPGFFSTLNIPLLAGRDFSEADNQDTPKAAIVNEQFSRFFFPGGDAVGRHLAFGAGNVKLNIEIVGVARDSDHDNLREKVARFIYIPYPQESRGGALRYFVKTAGNPLAWVGNVRRTVAEMDSHMPLNNVGTVESAIRESISDDRMVAWLASALGTLASGLACIGLYGLVSYMVARRTNEIGLRLALGASRSGVLWLVFGNSLRLISLGVAFGIALALAASRFVASMLYGLEATNPLVLAGATLVLLAVAALATYIPARRATRVDPMVALRYE
ncbi:MAG TPA: ABC transporter permease, partial [Terriglobia bacterium]|nr:ABC transporter permease [Terriglobia bacterium]